MHSSDEILYGMLHVQYTAWSVKLKMGRGKSEEKYKRQCIIAVLSATLRVPHAVDHPINADQRGKQRRSGYHRVHSNARELLEHVKLHQMCNSDL